MKMPLVPEIISVRVALCRRVTSQRSESSTDEQIVTERVEQALFSARFAAATRGMTKIEYRKMSCD